jgi:predicted NBD/HSP70 family sugar kinase
MLKNIPTALKLSNRKIVYNIISREDGISRADIARKTGISGATVIKIAEYLESRNIISYDPAESAAVPGRKPTPLRFNRNFAYIIAINMEGFYASLGILNVLGEVILSRELRISDTERFFQEDCYGQVDSLVTASGIDRGQLIGIGIAMPVAVDPVSKKVYRAPLFHDTHLANLESILGELSSRYSLPVFVENDVNAAAYGEYRRAYSELTDALVYISLGSGLGGGVILNRKLWKGQNASAGEVGYMLFDPRYRPSRQQPDGEELGWLESKINVTTLQEKFGFDIQVPVDKQKEIEIARYLSRYLSLSVLNIYAVLDIKTVVLGGILTEYLSDSLVNTVYREMGKTSAYLPDLAVGKLKKPGFAGLSYIIMDELLDNILSY